jgi:hypothetical protein
VLACERVLAELEGRPVDDLQAQSRSALAQAPHAAAWAYRFRRWAGPSAASAKRFRRQAAPGVVREAVEGIAQAAVHDPDAMLRDLLVQSIAECASLVGPAPHRGGGLREVPAAARLG